MESTTPEPKPEDENSNESTSPLVQAPEIGQIIEI